MFPWCEWWEPGQYGGGLWVSPTMFHLTVSGSDFWRKHLTPFEQYISRQVWLCWTKGSLSAGSRVHPQVTVHPNGPDISRRWQSAMSDPLNQSRAHSFLDSTYLYETAAWLSGTEGPLILKTERHRSVQWLRGYWGRGAHAEATHGTERVFRFHQWWQQVNRSFKTQLKLKSQKGGKARGLNRPCSVSQGSSRSIKTAGNNMLHNGEERPNLWAWVILWLVSASHLPRVSNALLCKQELFLLSNNNMNPGQSTWKCGASVIATLPLQFKASAWILWNLGRLGLWVLEMFLKLFLGDSHCFTLRVTRGPNAKCWLCKFWRF